MGGPRRPSHYGAVSHCSPCVAPCVACVPDAALNVESAIFMEVVMSRILMATTVSLLLGTACSPAVDSVSATAPSLETSHAASANGLAHGLASGTALSPEQLRAVATVRQATARFHDFAVSQAEGYTVQYPSGCRAAPAGAQGIHYMKEMLVDGSIDLRTPELIMYEPQPDGSMQLVGVDYIIPFSEVPSDATPPTILGVPMMQNAALQVWALHIWAWRPNPSGMFAMWNPSVSCANAN